MQNCKIEPLEGGRYALNVQLGCKKYFEHNLQNKYAATAKLKAIVSEAILSYINHRERALRRYARLDIQRADAIQRLTRRFADYKHWPPINLKAKVIGAKADLISLLPSAESRFYTNQTKLIYDIINLAESCHSADFVQVE